MKLQFGVAMEVDLSCFFCSQKLKNPADKEQIYEKLVFLECERNRIVAHIIAQDLNYQFKIISYEKNYSFINIIFVCF